jgi:polysaccharide pyruvyl transferase WcaK-like protein
VPLTAAVSELRRHRTVVLGGGTLFGRDMGRVGRLLPVYGLLAHLAGRRLAMVGVGVDEALPPLRARWVRELARAADWVGVRDDGSAAVLARWGVTASVSSDLSVLMPGAPIAAGRALLRSAGVSLRRPVIGLALTAVDPSLGEHVAVAVEGLARRMPDVELCFIPMSQHPFVASHNDLLFARDLQRRVPGLKVLDGTHHPALILAVFRALTAAVCMRYHSFVFAERAGIPFTGFSYAPKVDAWLTERGLHPSAPDAESLTANVEALMATQRLAS